MQYVTHTAAVACRALLLPRLMDSACLVQQHAAPGDRTLPPSFCQVMPFRQLEYCTAGRTIAVPLPRSVQSVPVSEYEDHLSTMVSAARQAGIANILLLTPPPVDDEGRVRHQQQVCGERGAEMQGGIHRATRGGSGTSSWWQGEAWPLPGGQTREDWGGGGGQGKSERVGKGGCNFGQVKGQERGLADPLLSCLTKFTLKAHELLRQTPKHTKSHCSHTHSLCMHPLAKAGHKPVLPDRALAAMRTLTSAVASLAFSRPPSY